MAGIGGGKKRRAFSVPYLVQLVVKKELWLLYWLGEKGRVNLLSVNVKPSDKGRGGGESRIHIRRSGRNGIYPNFPLTLEDKEEKSSLITIKKANFFKWARKKKGVLISKGKKTSYHRFLEGGGTPPNTGKYGG